MKRSQAKTKVDGHEKVRGKDKGRGGMKRSEVKTKVEGA